MARLRIANGHSPNRHHSRNYVGFVNKTGLILWLVQVDDSSKTVAVLPMPMAPVVATLPSNRSDFPFFYVFADGNDADHFAKILASAAGWRVIHPQRRFLRALRNTK